MRISAREKENGGSGKVFFGIRKRIKEKYRARPGDSTSREESRKLVNANGKTRGKGWSSGAQGFGNDSETSKELFFTEGGQFTGGRILIWGGGCTGLYGEKNISTGCRGIL